MTESRTSFVVEFDREVERVRLAMGKEKAPSIRELLEKTQDKALSEKVRSTVETLVNSSGSKRYPTVAQVRKMLAANDNVVEEVRDYSAIAAEYKNLFEQCLAQSGDVTSLIDRLSRDKRVSLEALATITSAITGRPKSKISQKAAKTAILDKFADLGVSLMAKRAASSARPF